MRRASAILVAAALATALTGCDQSDKARQSSDGTITQALAKPLTSQSQRMREVAASTAPVAADVVDTAAAAPAAVDGPAAPQGPIVPAGAPMLAYSYAFGIEAPAGKVRGLEAVQEAACVAAGPSQCQVTSSTVRDVGPGVVTGELALRAAPTWLAKFRAGLAADAKAAGGRVTSTQVGSEDLSRQIVDTEAALRAKTTLRDRLQGLLASHPGSLSDLLDVERELANVQGEIDATQSELAMMQARVATSEVTIQYASSGGVASRGVWSPLAEALGDFFGLLAGTLGVMVRLAAVLTPWLLVLGGGYWLFSRRFPVLAFWRRRPKTPPPGHPN